MGRQPEAGFTFSVLYRPIISCCIFAGSSLNFSRISFIRGVRARIRAMDL